MQRHHRLFSSFVVAFTIATVIMTLVIDSARAQDTSLCCETTDYSSNWQNCPNAADPSVGTVTSCSQCMAYSCLDWTAGSNEMTSREASFLQETGNDVFFGVGSYGNNQARAGNCYRFTAAGVSKDLIVQVVNQGGDVPDGNFDLLMSDGGFGVYDACVAGTTNVPQFTGTTSDWGNQYGGWDSISGCTQIASTPICSSGNVNNNDNMQTLCQWSFNENLRTNPTITNMCQVSCPSELWQATGIHRSDEPVTNTYTCGSSNPAVSNGGQMTRMMDCAKPSYGWASNVQGSTYSGYAQVVPCRRDGYTRINAMPVTTTYTPTNAPTPGPTSPTSKPIAPSASPSKQPTTAAPTSQPVTLAPNTVLTTAPTAAPVSNSATCLCNYGTGCDSNNPCCAGLVCNTFTGYSQCLEDSAYKTSVNNCYITVSAYGCTASSQCCNPADVCVSDFCQLPCSLPSSTPVTATTTTPSSAPVTASAAPVSTNLPSTAPVSNRPVKAPVVAPVSTIVPSSAPVTATTTTTKPSSSPIATKQPATTPTISTTPSFVPINTPTSPTTSTVIPSLNPAANSGSNTSSSSSTISTKIAAIIGAVAGAVALIILIAIGWRCFKANKGLGGGNNEPLLKERSDNVSWSDVHGKNALL